MIDLKTRKQGASRAVIAMALAGLTLSACQPSSPQAAASSAPAPLSAIPLATSGAPPIAPAPLASALPPAAPASVGRLANSGDRYAFADRAYAMNSAFGDAPPDYTFNYGGGERPWVWRGDDQSTRVAEPLPGGGFRYYFYEPGSQTPYLVRDPDHSYAYDNGALVVVYDRRGQAISDDQLGRQAEMAGRFLARAQAIYAASQREQREAVAEANWAARRSQIDAERAQWQADQEADQEWQAYHAAHQQEEQSQWDAERYRREAQAARFAEQINNAQLAAQDWQAAQRAQSRAVAVGQPPKPQNPGGGLLGGPRPPQQPQPQPVQPPTPPSPQPQRHQPPSPTPPAQPESPQPFGPTGGPDHRSHDRQPPSGPPGMAPGAVHGAPIPAFPANPGPNAAGLAARQAQLQAQHQAELAAQAQAQTQAARQAQLAAQHQAELQTQAAARAQALAARQAQAEAQHQAQLGSQAAAHAQGEAEAARLAAARAKLNATPTPPAPPPHHETAKPANAPPPVAVRRPEPPTPGKPTPPPHHGGPHDEPMSGKPPA